MGRIAALALALILLAGCAPEAPATAEETVFGDQVKTLDKARSVQDDVDARKKELDERMKQAEDGG